jgi:hypothetical protein
MQNIPQFECIPAGGTTHPAATVRTATITPDPTLPSRNLNAPSAATSLLRIDTLFFRAQVSPFGNGHTAGTMGVNCKAQEIQIQ